MVLKVAAYARVSTDKEDQFNSLTNQREYFESYIKSNGDWEFVEVYFDEGITGTQTKKRKGFNRMINDCKNGKIDLILTKEVSRFARNTVDSLTTIRLLKENNVECYFEKENIWTFDGKGELLLTIMSSISQEEARSISENVTWGHRKRFADGKVSVAYSRFLGYDKGPDGKMVVNPEQAEIVKLIYRLFLEGMTPHTIAIHLTEKGIKTPGGKDKWNATTIRRILTNEKYKGDALLQKEFTVDFLTKKTKKNCGEIPMYYIEDDHEAIIDPAVFDMVQQEMERRKTGTSRYSGVSIFSSKIKCGECGGGRPGAHPDAIPLPTGNRRSHRKPWAGPPAKPGRSVRRQDAAKAHDLPPTRPRPWRRARRRGVPARYPACASAARSYPLRSAQ